MARRFSVLRSTAELFRQEVGIKLEVTPQINEGSSVVLKIKIEVSGVAGVPMSGIDIITNKRAIETTALVDNNQIIVLGGLVDEEGDDADEAQHGHFGEHGQQNGAQVNARRLEDRVLHPLEQHGARYQERDDEENARGDHEASLNGGWEERRRGFALPEERRRDVQRARHRRSTERHLKTADPTE